MDGGSLSGSEPRPKHRGAGLAAAVPGSLNARASLPPCWLFAIFSLIPLLAIDVLDSARRVVVIMASLILVAGAASAFMAIVVYGRR